MASQVLTHAQTITQALRLVGLLILSRLCFFCVLISNHDSRLWFSFFLYKTPFTLVTHICSFDRRIIFLQDSNWWMFGPLSWKNVSTPATLEHQIFQHKHVATCPPHPLISAALPPLCQGTSPGIRTAPHMWQNFEWRTQASPTKIARICLTAYANLRRMKALVRLFT